MSHNRNPLVFLDNIEQSLKQIEFYINSISYADYRVNFQLQDAVCMRLQIIGENSSKLDEKLKNKFPEVAWHKIRAMRNIISHDYYSLDSLIIWDVITLELPKLHKVVSNLKAKLE